MKIPKIKNIARVVLGTFLTFAGVSHLTFNREEFLAQVPKWLPVDQDFTVLASGAVEISLGLSLIFWRSKRKWVGIAAAVFFLLIFPGNVSQYVHKIDAFGLDTDNKRFLRLFFQPLLIIWALWSADSLNKNQLLINKK